MSVVDDIEKRWAKTTPGPWRTAWDHPELIAADGESVMIATVNGDPWSMKPGGGFVMGVLWHDGPLPCCRRENATAIASAPTDIATLIAHARAQDVIVDAVRRLGVARRDDAGRDARGDAVFAVLILADSLAKGGT